MHTACAVPLACLLLTPLLTDTYLNACGSSAIVCCSGWFRQEEGPQQPVNDVLGELQQQQGAAGAAAATWGGGGGLRDGDEGQQVW
jgi:hypothetical protein